MRVESIDETIRVLADFSAGQVRPLRFRWGQRTYPVSAVNGQWVDRQGDHPAMHFSVQADGQTWYLRYDTAGCQWWLDQLIVP